MLSDLDEEEDRNSFESDGVHYRTTALWRRGNTADLCVAILVLGSATGAPRPPEARLLHLLAEYLSSPQESATP